jgi:hypothetical protein
VFYHHPEGPLVFEVQVQRLIPDPIHALLPSKTSHLVLFDVLDECEDPKAILRLITLIVHPRASSNLRVPLCVFVTSRPEPALGDLFDSIQVLNYTLQDFSTSVCSLQDVHRSRSSVMVDFPPVSASDGELDALVVRTSGVYHLCDHCHHVHQRQTPRSPRTTVVVAKSDIEKCVEPTQLPAIAASFFTRPPASAPAPSLAHPP